MLRANEGAIRHGFGQADDDTIGASGGAGDGQR
jgi:hypothetical protein